MEKVEFHRFANRLRITGVIVAGVEDSGHHTINITVGKELSIIKEWKEEQLRRIKEAEEAARRPEIIIVTVEEGEASIGVVRQWGVEEVESVRQSYGKDRGSYRREFFGEIASAISRMEFKYLVVAGPGFAKEDFMKFLREKHPDMAEKAIVVDTSSTGTRGFIEVLKRGVLDRIAGELRIAEEAKYLDILLERIAKGSGVAYGLGEVREVVGYSAVETLLVADEFLREEREKWDIDSLLREVERGGGKVFIMSTEFEPGKRLMALGGIAALLRFDYR